MALTAVSVGAALSALALGLSGWPHSVAQAAPFADAPVAFRPVTLGVDEETAVTLGPEVDTDVKFESSEATMPAATEHALLLVGTAKAVAPVKVAVRKAVAKPAVARKPVRRASVSGWKSARVSWYGPGFYGNTMAGGGKLQADSMVVAHRSLPFGTKIQFKYKGKTCTAVVKDRGPFVGGRTFDLGPGTAKALGFGGVGTVHYKILGK